MQIDLGQSYALDEMWVWNMNQQNNIGRGLKNVKIEYSADGVKWQNLEPEEGMSFTDSPEGYPFQLAPGYRRKRYGGHQPERREQYPHPV